MCRRSFSDVATRRGSFKPQISFQQWNKGECRHKMMEIAPMWIKLMPGICWWHLFHKKQRKASLRPLKFSNHSSNAVFSNASPGLTVRCFSGVNIGVFWMRESSPIEWRQCRLSTRQFFFSLHIYSLWWCSTWIGIWDETKWQKHTFRSTRCRSTSTIYFIFQARDTRSLFLACFSLSPSLPPVSLSNHHHYHHHHQSSCIFNRWPNRFRAIRAAGSGLVGRRLRKERPPRRLRQSCSLPWLDSQSGGVAVILDTSTWLITVHGCGPSWTRKSSREQRGMSLYATTDQRLCFWYHVEVSVLYCKLWKREKKCLFIVVDIKNIKQVWVRKGRGIE